MQEKLLAEWARSVAFIVVIWMTCAAMGTACSKFMDELSKDAEAQRQVHRNGWFIMDPDLYGCHAALNDNGLMVTVCKEPTRWVGEP